MKRQLDCLCAGIVVADHVCAPIDHMPAPGELVTTDRTELAIGGCASNVAVDLVRLGLDTAVAGIVGKDLFGRFVRESLQAAGVVCDHLVESTTRQTSGTFVINTRGEDRRFVHTVGANAEFSGREIAPELIQSCRALYLGGYCLMDSLSPGSVAELFQAARQAGVATLLDVVIPGPADYWPRLEPVLPWTDVFFPNSDEARVITGLDDPLAQAEQFHQAGAKTVVVTCGGDGAVLVGNGVKLQIGSFPVDFIDGTGSGDAFVAGYIYGLLKGADIQQCLRYGSALGASCVRRTGATQGVFTHEELENFVADHDLPIKSASAERFPP